MASHRAARWRLVVALLLFRGEAASGSRTTFPMDKVPADASDQTTQAPALPVNDLSGLIEDGGWSAAYLNEMSEAPGMNSFDEYANFIKAQTPRREPKVLETPKRSPKNKWREESRVESKKEEEQEDMTNLVLIDDAEVEQLHANAPPVKRELFPSDAEFEDAEMARPVAVDRRVPGPFGPPQPPRLGDRRGGQALLSPRGMRMRTPPRKKDEAREKSQGSSRDKLKQQLSLMSESKASILATPGLISETKDQAQHFWQKARGPMFHARDSVDMVRAWPRGKTDFGKIPVESEEARKQREEMAASIHDIGKILLDKYYADRTRTPYTDRINQRSWLGAYMAYKDAERILKQRHIPMDQLSKHVMQQWGLLASGVNTYSPFRTKIVPRHDHF